MSKLGNSRCDKNGDGKLSEDEVKEVSPDRNFVNSSSSPPPSSMIINLFLQTYYGKGDNVECLHKQAIKS